MESVLKEGILWFRRELRDLMPKRFGELLSQPPRVLLLIVRKGELELVLYRSKLFGLTPRRTSLGSGSWQDLDQPLRTQLRSWGWVSTVELAVPIDRCLVLQKHIPVSAVERCDDIIKMDLQRSNPRGLEDIEFGHILNAPEREGQQIQATCFVCKRSIFSLVLDQLGSLNIVPAALRVVDADGTLLAANLMPAQSASPPSMRILSSVSRALCAIFVALFVTGVLVRHVRVEAAIAEAGSVVDELKARAKSQKQALSSAAKINDVIASLRLRRLETPTSVEIWEELTKILPGSAWLVEFRVEDHVITIDGSARSASELVALLSKSSMFQGVEFAAPVTRDAQRATERFQLRAKLVTGAARQ